MPYPLKQATAHIMRMGPFLDDTDGKTPETGLTITQADIQISKAGGTFTQTNAESPTTTHDVDGWYQVPVTVSDTGTLGPLTAQVAMAGALPVWRECHVLPANVYDSLYSTDKLQVDLAQWLGTAAATPSVAGVPKVDLTHVFGTILSEGGAGRLAAAFIKLFDVTTPLLVASDVMRGTDSAATAAVWTAARAGALTDWINGGRLDNLLDAIPTTAMRGTDDAALASVWTEARAGALTDWINGGRLDLLIDAIKAVTDNLPNNGALSDLAAILIDTSTTLPATLVTVAEYVDTEVAAIKAKTDNLPGSPAAVGSAMTLAADAIDAASIKADAGTELATALLDLVNGIETGYTLRQALRLVLSAAAAKLSGAATSTVSIRDVGDAKDRIVATVDENGNRSAVVLDAT